MRSRICSSRSAIEAQSPSAEPEPERAAKPTPLGCATCKIVVTAVAKFSGNKTNVAKAIAALQKECAELFAASTLKHKVEINTSDLTHEQLQPVIEKTEIRAFKKGQELFSEGDAGDGLYLIQKGSVTVSRCEKR